MRYRFKPSKPMALFTTLVALAILAVGLTGMHRFTPLAAVWAVAVVGIVAFTIWAAFSPRGSLYSARGERREDR